MGEQRHIAHGDKDRRSARAGVMRDSNDENAGKSGKVRNCVREDAVTFLDS